MIWWLITLPFRLFKWLVSTLFGAQKKPTEEEKRANTPFHFNQDLSYDDFKAAIYETSIPIKQIVSIIIDGPKATFKVKSLLGIYYWQFDIDFNDYGVFSGKYWLNSTKRHSEIPKKVASNVTKICLAVIESRKRITIQGVGDKRNKVLYYKCEYCGAYAEPVQNLTSFYCPYCGKTINTKAYLTKYQIDNAKIEIKHKVDVAENYYRHRSEPHYLSSGCLLIIVGGILSIISLYLIQYFARNIEI